MCPDFLAFRFPRPVLDRLVDLEDRVVLVALASLGVLPMAVPVAVLVLASE